MLHHFQEKCIFVVYTEIQNGHQKWRGKRFLAKSAICSGGTIHRELDFRTRVRVLASTSIPLETSVINSRGGTSTNNSGRLLADKNSTRHRALAIFSIHHNRKRHPIWRLP